MQNLHNRRLGKLGEEIASKFLQDKGYVLLFRNYRTRYDEIDIIGKRNGLLTFFEVKTKIGDKFGLPHESVNFLKLKHLKRAIQYFLLKNRVVDTKLSLDVVSIVLDTNEKIKSIKHFENIIKEGGIIW